MAQPLAPVPLDEIRAARARIAVSAVRTPLVRMQVDGPPQIYLKLESLQPIGSFKIRGAANAVAVAAPSEVARGLWTASAGNMAQGVAWEARRLGVPCTVVVPDSAPETKRDAVRRLGGKVEPVPFDEWWAIFGTRRGQEGLFVHPFADPAVMAGNGTIGLEILEDLPDVDAVVIPYGGGGLSAGIASAIRALRPEVRIHACEAETAAPLAPSLAAGSPVTVPYRPSFVDGIGGPEVFPEMLELASRLLDGSIVRPLSEIAEALRLLVERSRVVAEGAGAASVAAALSGQAGTGKVVCVVSGGNIDAPKLVKILEGRIP
ncbi:MAG: threonine ammonia-lyase [Actinomycetota bacterium]